METVFRLLKSQTGFQMRKELGTVFFIFIVHQLLVFSTIYLSRILYAKPGESKSFYEIITENTIHWDGKWFLTIAENGYTLQSSAFFPLYPGLIRVFSDFGFDPVVSGLIISNTAFFISCWLLYKLVSIDWEPGIAVETLWYMTLFPTSFFFNVVYSESLFMLFVLLTFYGTRTGRWWLAGAAGLLAALTRNTGFFLAVPAAYEYLSYKEYKIRKIGLNILWIGLIPLGLCIYMIYLARVVDDPLGFMTAQKFWQRSFTYPWQSLNLTLKNIFIDFGRGRNLLDLSFTILGFGAALVSARKIRFSYWIYMVMGLFLPLWAASPHAGLFSMPRFILVLFPIYLATAATVRNLNIRTALLAFYSGLLVYLGIMFSYSRWVA